MLALGLYSRSDVRPIFFSLAGGFLLLSLPIQALAWTFSELEAETRRDPVGARLLDELAAVPGAKPYSKLVISCEEVGIAGTLDGDTYFDTWRGGVIARSDAELAKTGGTSFDPNSEPGRALMDEFYGGEVARYRAAYGAKVDPKGQRFFVKGNLIQFYAIGVKDRICVARRLERSVAATVLVHELTHYLKRSRFIGRRDMLAYRDAEEFVDRAMLEIGEEGPAHLAEYGAALRTYGLDSRVPQVARRYFDREGRFVGRASDLMDMIPAKDQQWYRNAYREQYEKDLEGSLEVAELERKALIPIAASRPSAAAHLASLEKRIAEMKQRLGK